ncbi:MAG TPA: hypothetical protein ENN53_01090 [Candidatus Acetothermia bacterium]|nr:hypothetical protein [Candidatus Acetothermia bacterium]
MAARRGVEVGMKRCPTCQGKAAIWCKQCNGTGTVGNLLVGFTKCSRCDGLGEHKCPNCHGKGVVAS